MVTERNPYELAAPTQPPVAPQPDLTTAREVFPIMLEKDLMDLRPVTQPSPGDELLAPKASSAPVSVESLSSTTGLEDVSEEDLVTSVPESVEKDMTPPSTSLTSTESTSPGKPVPPAAT